MLALLVLIVGVSAACPAGDFYRYSYSLCKNTTACVDSFFLDQVEFIDFKHFKLMLEIFMHQTDVTIADACESEVLWAKLMSKNKPCLNVNEFFNVAKEQCICRPDKICIELNPWDFGVKSVTSIVVGALIVFLIAGYGAKSLRAQRRDVASKQSLGLHQ